MTPEEWGEAKAILAEAMELPADQRLTLLDRRCAGKPSLRREIESLLSASDDDGFLDAGLPLPDPGLASGQVLGPYKVEKKLAEGGMGEVYQAFDSRLERRVAIKVLPARLSRDASALLRFERETKALAALSHPNILTIFDVGRSGATAFAVTELLIGSTLRQRLERGRLPVPTAVEVAAQAARGLAAAHAEGIVHRDLKPENLFLTAGSGLKILDFGIAFTLPPAGKNGLRERLTAEHSVIGTARYMSPEQARGESCDHRSDLFSLGAVLYEMLTGSPAFAVETPLTALHVVAELEPLPLAALCLAASPQLVRLVHRCLEKEPDRRFQSASDLAFHLASLTEGPAAAPSPSPALPPTAPAPAGRRRFLRAGAVAGLLLALALLATLFVQRPWKQGEPPRFQRLTFRRGFIHSARFAPDGRTIVYSAAWDGRPYELFSTRVESPESRSLGLPSAFLHAISPRGEMLVSLIRETDGTPTGYTLARVPLGGGAPRPIEEAYKSRWADWAPDGESFALLQGEKREFRIEYPHGKAIWHSYEYAWDLRLAPGGDALAFCHLPKGTHEVVILDRTGKVMAKSGGWGYPPMRASAESPRGCLAWAPDGKEVWFAATRPGGESGLYALTRAGKVRPLLRVPGAMSLLLFDIARDGRALLAQVDSRGSLMVRAPGEKEERDLAWLEGAIMPILSADGRQVVFTEWKEGGGAHASVYLRGTDGSPAVRLGEGVALAISPDGRWVVTRTLADARRLVLLPTGAGESRALPPLPMPVFLAEWPLGGNQLLINGIEPGRGRQVYALEVGAKTARLLTSTEASLSAPSPDGTRFAATSAAAGVRIYALAGGKPYVIPGVQGMEEWPIQWRADGRALYLGRETRDGRYLIDEVDLATGRRSRWKELRAADPAGAEFGLVRMTPHAEAYAYTSGNMLSTLYLAEGLR